MFLRQAVRESLHRKRQPGNHWAQKSTDFLAHRTACQNISGLVFSLAILAADSIHQLDKWFADKSTVAESYSFLQSLSNFRILCRVAFLFEAQRHRVSVYRPSSRLPFLPVCVRRPPSAVQALELGCGVGWCNSQSRIRVRLNTRSIPRYARGRKIGSREAAWFGRWRYQAVRSVTVS